MLTWTKTKFGFECAPYIIERDNGYFRLYAGGVELTDKRTSLKACKRLAEDVLEEVAPDLVDPDVLTPSMRASTLPRGWDPDTDDRDTVPFSSLFKPEEIKEMVADICPKPEGEQRPDPTPSATPGSVTPNRRTGYDLPPITEPVFIEDAYNRLDAMAEVMDGTPIKPMPSAPRRTRRTVILLGRVGNQTFYASDFGFHHSSTGPADDPAEVYADLGKSQARKLRRMAREAGFADFARVCAAQLTA